MAGIVGVHVLLGLLLYEPVLYTGGDNAGYMILGDALRSGEGYRDVYRPDAPLHTKYPPGYPALLAVAGFFGGLQLFKVLSLAASAAAVGLTYRVGRRMAGPRVGLVAAAVVAVNPVLLQYSHWVLTETAFTAVTLLAVACYLRREGAADPAWRGGLASATGAFFLRTAGAPLLAATVATHVVRREWRRTLVSAVVTAIAAGGWFVYQRVAPGGRDYFGEFARVGTGAGEVGSLGSLELITRAGDHLWYYVATGFPWSVLGSSIRASDEALPVVLLGLLLTGLAVAGWVGRARDEAGLPEWFALFYVGLISVWWKDLRFLLPLYPLLVIYVLLGARAATRALSLASSRDRRGVTAAIGVLLVVPGVGSSARLVPERVACVAAYRAGDPCLPGRWRSFHAAARWAGDNVREDAVFANRKPRIFYWISGHRGEVYPFTTDHEELFRGLEEMGADFVVVDVVSRTTPTFLVPAIESRLDWFGQVYSEGSPPTTILHYRPGGGSGQGGGP